MSSVVSSDMNPNDPGRGPMVIGILWSLTIVASGTILARFYVRKKIGALSWDDWFMLLALVCPKQFSCFKSTNMLIWYSTGLSIG